MVPGIPGTGSQKGCHTYPAFSLGAAGPISDPNACTENTVLTEAFLETGVNQLDWLTAQPAGPGSHLPTPLTSTGVTGLCHAYFHNGAGDRSLSHLCSPRINDIL